MSRWDKGENEKNSKSLLLEEQGRLLREGGGDKGAF